MLVDGIYPRWAMFARTCQVPTNKRERNWRERQESMRKDVERCFGILKKQWRILYNPFLKKSKSLICQIVETCLILHKMNVEDQNTDACEEGEENVQDQRHPDDSDNALRAEELRRIRDATRPQDQTQRLLEAGDENEHMRLYQALIRETWSQKVRRNNKRQRQS